MDKQAAVNDNGEVTVCKQVCYSGRVQGVGFRYTARHLAEDFRVAGYVRNLPSGNVDLVLEGTLHEVEAFLASLAQRMAGYIERATVEDRPCQGYEDFQIRF